LVAWKGFVIGLPQPQNPKKEWQRKMNINLSPALIYSILAPLPRWMGKKGRREGGKEGNTYHQKKGKFKRLGKIPTPRVLSLAPYPWFIKWEKTNLGASYTPNSVTKVADFFQVQYLHWKHL